jgi:glyoxylase-like metal-dependent hydrolase (beta-lactamase superfamily II)
LIADEQDLIDRTSVAPDAFAKGVDLFPMPGVSPGACGLLLALPQQTVLICGDTVATSEHLEQGRIRPSCWNRDQAMESFKEAVEIADLLILGRDNAISNPVRARGLLG